MPEKPFWQYPHGFVLFCDDVRLEVGGKQTLVGTYQGGMLVMGDFPFICPKLAFSAHYREPMDVEPCQTLTLKVFLETGDAQQALFESAIDGTAFRNAGLAVDLTQPGESGHTEVVINGVFAPLVIPGPSRLRVRMFRDEEEVRVGTLSIVKAPAAVLQGDAAQGAPTMSARAGSGG